MKQVGNELAAFLLGRIWDMGRGAWDMGAVCRFCIIGLLSLVSLLVTSHSLLVTTASAVSQTINVQGKVTNTNGTNVADGLYDFVFKLYDGAGNGAGNSFTETWSAGSLFTSTMSSAPASGGTSLTYSSNTNESSLKAGQILWNTTKQESVRIIAVNTSTNTITISATSKAWNTTDTITNRIYVKDGIFNVSLNSLNNNWGTTNFSNGQLYLGVNFNGDGEMKPRSQLQSVPFAFRAQSAESVDGLSIGSGKTVTFNNSISFSGADGTSFSLPSTSGTLVTTNATQALTNKTLNNAIASGSLTLSNMTTNGGVLFTNGSGVLSQTSAGSSGQCLQSNGGGAPTWGACGTPNAVTGTGASGQLTFWTGTTTQSGDTNLFWDNASKRLGIGTNSPSTMLTLAGGIGSQNGYSFQTAGSDNMLMNGDFEQGGVYGWSGLDGVTTDSHSGMYAGEAIGSSTVTSDDFIPVDPAHDVLQLEGYFKKSVIGSTPGVIYFGYMAYDENKSVITSSPCGTYCYFAASGRTIPQDSGWHKYSATTTGEGTTYPNFPVGTKFVKVLVLINHNGSANTVTLMDHLSVKKINNGALFVGNNFSSTNMEDQFQQSKLYTTASGHLVVEPASGGNVGIGVTNPGTALDVSGAIRSSNGLIVSAGSVSLPNNAITDAMVSNTLTSSIFIGSGSTTNAVDLGTAEVAGTLANARLVNSGALTVSAGNGLTGGGLVALGGTTTLTIGAGSGITVGSSTVSIASDGVTDAHLLYNTGQHLTTSSDPTFNGLSLTNNLVMASGNGINFANLYGVYERTYSVTTAAPLPLRDVNGNLFNVNSSYKVQGVVTSTGTNTGATAFFYGNGTSFEIERSYEAGTSSNHIEFFLDAGIPSVRLYGHTSTYAVSVLTEQFPNKGRGGSENYLYANYLGSIGIGNENPQATLDIAGTLRASGAVTLSYYTTNGGVLYTNGSGLVAQTGVGSAGQCLQSNGGGAPIWGSCSTGSITGSGANGQISFWNGSSTQVGDSNLVWDNANKRLGIGTSNPEASLSIRRDAAGGTIDGIRINNLSTTTGTSARIVFGFSTVENIYSAGIGAIRTNDPGAHASALTFSTCSGSCTVESNLKERMRIDAIGNVGIGTPAPNHALDVVGIINASSDIQTSGNLIEKKVEFTPTTTGWYRIALQGGRQGGVVRIHGGYDNSYSDIELQYNIGGYGVGGSIQQTRYSSYNGGVVNQARISSNGSNETYLDIHVYKATTPGPITLYGYGPEMPSFIASPVVGAVAGASNEFVLSLGHGFRSTSGLVASGVTSSAGLTVSAGTLSLPNNSITDAMVSNTLTASIFAGSGSTTNAVDLATAEVAGILPNSRLTGSGALTVAAGNGLTGGGSVALGGTTTLTVGAGSGITVGATTVSITSDGVTDVHLEYNTGQHLTTTSSPTFGGLNLNGVSTEGVSSFRTYRNLASYSSDINGSPGAFVIQTNVPMTANDMTRTVIEGYFYDSTAPFKMEIGGYWYSSGSWPNRGYINVGQNKLSVRFAREISSGNVAIILGSEGDSYYYPKLSVTQFMHGYGGISEAHAQGWTISQQTDLSGYGDVTSVPDRTSIAASSVTGTISNSQLANNGALTVTAGSGLTGGGSVALGGTTTINIGSDAVTDTHLQFNTGQHLTTSSSPTFGGLSVNGAISATGVVTANSTDFSPLMVHRGGTTANVAIGFRNNSGGPYYFGADVSGGYFGFVDSVVGISSSALKIYVSSGNITTTGTITGNGSGLTDLNGSNISSGTVANSRLVNSGALTITAGNGLTGGGSTALGGSTTLTVGAGSGITVGTTTVSITADGVTDAHLQYNTGQHLTTTSSPSFSGLRVNNGAHVETNTDTTPLTISRQFKSSNFEEVRVGVTDNTTTFHYINDEAASNLIFRMENTDTEGGGGANATDHNVLTLQAGSGGATATIGGGLIVSSSVRFSSFTTNGGILYTDASGVLAQTTAGTAGQCLQSNGGGAPTWGSCAASDTITGSGSSGQISYWDGLNTQTGDSNFIWDNTNKRLGIGTGTPQTALHIRNTSPNLTLSNPTLNSANSGTIDFLEDDNAFGAPSGYGFRLTYDGTANNFIIQSANSGSVVTSLTINRSTGNISFGGTISGNGSGLTNLNGSNISTGTVANARLVNSGALTVSAGNGLTGGGSVALGGSTSLTVGAGSGITVGSTTVSVTTDGITDTHLQYNTGQHLTATSSPTFGGLTINGGSIQMRIPNTTGGWARGVNFSTSDGSETIIGFGAYGNNSDLNYGYIGKAYNNSTLRFYEDKRVVFDGVVGVGVTLPSEAIDVSGNIKASGMIISTASTGTAPLQVSSSTLVTNLNADMVDGMHASDFSQKTNHSATIPGTPGWYRIAVNGNPETATGGSRASALFTIRDLQSSRHGTTTFYASVNYGNNPTITMLNRSFYSSDGVIKKVRIIEASTYDGAAVEIYVDNSTNTSSVEYTISENEQSTGWTPVDWEAGNLPVGFTETLLDFDTYNPIIAAAANGNNNLFHINRSGNVTFSGVITGNGSELTNLNGSNISTGTVANARLVNSGALTITAGNGLTGGGSTALGGSTTLTVGAGSGITVGATTVSVTTDGITDTHLQYNTGQHLTTSSSPSFGGLTLGSGSSTLSLTPYATISPNNPGTTTAGAVIEGPVNAHMVFDIRNNDSRDAFAIRYSSTNNTTVDTIGLVFNANGRLGIGTINPSQALDVVGNIAFSGTISGNGSGLTSLNGSNISSGTIANARLTNSGALTVTAGSGLTGGGSVALGGNTTIDIGSNAVTNAHLQYDTGQHLTTSSSPTFSGLTVSNNISFDGLTVKDTRNVNDAPGDFSKEVTFEFKNRATVGAPGTGTYSGMLTFAPWSDASGGNNYQLNFNAGGLFLRRGDQTSGTWNAWEQVITGSSNAITINSGSGLSGGGTVALGDSTTISIGSNSVTDAHLQYDTGQHLTSTSSPTFGGLTLNGISIEGASNFRTYRNLASYSQSSSSAAGAFVIQTNVPMTANAMTRTVIEGYFYDSSSPFKIDVGSYFYSSGTFNNRGYVNVGNKKLTVRLGKNTATGNVVIILGDEGSTYSYPKLTVTQFMHGHSSINESYADNWSISQETSLAAYDTIVSVPDVTTIAASSIAGTISNSQLTNSGALSVLTGSGLTGGGSIALGGSRTISVATNSLNFSHFTDSLSLDAPTTITLGSHKLTFGGTAGIDFGHTGDTVFTGNVGIGSASTSTAAKLSVVASINSNAGGLSNQHLALLYPSNTNGVGPGISFGTSINAANIGAKITFERTGADSMGDLVFYTKGTTGAGDLTTERMRIDNNGNVLISDGLLVVGDIANGNYVALSETLGMVRFGTAQPTRVITISPEYTNATFITDGSANIAGNMITENTNSSATSYRNYYEWKSDEATLQEYTIAVRYTLPEEFHRWDTNAFSLSYQTGTANTADNAVSAQIIESSQSTPACNLSTDRASTTWTTSNMTCSGETLDDGTNDWDSAGETAIIKIKVKAKNTASAFARVGDIVLRYKAYK